MAKRLKTENDKIRKGDTFIGHCWLCGSVCMMERLANGHDKKTAIYLERRKK